MLEILKKQIRQSELQAITYCSYMETVLYHPTMGYYMKEREKIGKQGDFYTSTNISNVFAKKFAHFFIKLVEDKIIPAHICEIGGGTGKFAYDLLGEWKQRSPHTFSKLQYSMVEMSPYHRMLQKQALDVFPFVKQVDNVDSLGAFEGIIFSNELFDAFPAHVIEKQNDRLYEVYIALNETEQLTEVFIPLQNPQIEEYLKKHKLVLQNGQRFEVPVFMSGYIAKLGKCLKQGLLVTVDYGYTNKDWMKPAHREGSLRGYYKHTLVSDPLKHPGEMDLTTHIHWDEIVLEGRKHGFDLIWHTRQTEFLLAAGILHDLVEHADPNPFSEQNKQNRAVRSMILSGGMSSFFDVMIQQKGLDAFSIESYLDTTVVKR